MAKTRRWLPGPLLESDSIELDDRGSATGVTGSLYNDGDDLFAHDSRGAFNLRQMSLADSEASNTESTTTSTTFQNKLNFTTPTLISGDYVVLWSCEASRGVVSGAEIQALVNSSVIGFASLGGLLSGEYLPLSGIVVVALSGAIGCQIQFRSLSGLSTASIRRARMAVIGI